MYLPEETVRIPSEALPFMVTVLYSEGILTVHLVPRGTMTSRTKDLPSALKDERIFPDWVKMRTFSAFPDTPLPNQG